MCGLVGIANSTALTKAQQRYFVEALYVDQLRGEDATGAALVDKDNNVEVIKRSLSAADFMMVKAGRRMIDMLDGTFVALGHNRASTIGRSIDDNAHPFEFDRYVGAHNGTITNYRTLLPVYKYAVDSANLIASIDKEGTEVLTEVRSGSYALTLYDKKEQHMVFVRNDGRPLHLLENNGQLLWASESEMLYWLASRNGMLTKDSNFIEVPTHEIIRYDCNEMKIVDRAKYTVKEYTNYYNYGNHGNVSHSSSTTTSTAASSTRLNDMPRHTSTPEFTCTWGKLSGGEVKGVKFDFSLFKTGIENTLKMSSKGCLMIPVEFNEYNNKSTAGKKVAGTVMGYIFSSADACFYPCLAYNVDKYKFDEAEETGSYMVCNVYAAYCTADGNITHMTAGDVDLAADTDGNAMSFYENDSTVDAVLTLTTNAFSLGKVYSVIKDTFCDNIKDRFIVMAYEDLKAKRQQQRDVVATINKSTSGKEVKSATSKTTGAPKKAVSKTDTALLEHDVEGPGGKKVTPTEFARLTRGGCSVCSETIYLEDAAETEWYGDNNQPICKNCSRDAALMEQLHLTGSKVCH